MTDEEVSTIKERLDRDPEFRTRFVMRSELNLLLPDIAHWKTTGEWLPVPELPETTPALRESVRKLLREANQT